MTAVINALSGDHHNLTALLRALEAQVTTLKGGGQADLEVVELVLGYCRRYGDQVHHPLENLVYDRLCETDAQLKGVLGAVCQDHVLIDESTKNLLEEVRDLMENCRPPTADLTRQLAAFIEGYHKHMAQEDKVLFPLAQERLSPMDWTVVEARAQNLPGAIYAQQVQERFLALRDYIHRLQRLDETDE